MRVPHPELFHGHRFWLIFGVTFTFTLTSTFTRTRTVTISCRL